MRMHEKVNTDRVRTSKTAVVMDFLTNPDGVKRIVDEWLERNGFSCINDYNNYNKVYTKDEKSLQYKITANKVIISIFFGTVNKSISLLRTTTLPSVSDAEEYGLSIIELLKDINLLSIENGFDCKTVLFEKKEYELSSFEEYWSELCLQRKQECGKRALDYCAVGFLGTAALIWGIRRVLEVYLGENMFSYPNPSTECGILLLSGVLFLFVGCKMSMGYALVALKTTARKKAVLAIILNFLFLIASVAVLIITIAEV